MGIRWAKVDKISDKMRLDGAKMRKMKDVSSVFAPWRAYERRKPANNGESRGPGEGEGRG